MQSNDAAFSEYCPSLRLKILDITRIGQNKIKLLAQDLSRTIAIRRGSAQNDNDRVHIMVAGVWATLEFTRDQIILLRDVPAEPAANHFNIDNTKGLLIIEPDSLISCTAVASALFCERKTWLDHVFAKRYQTTRNLLIGKLIHQLFLNAIKYKINDSNLLARQLDEILCDELVMSEIYAAAWDINIIRNVCLEYARTIASWVDRFILSGAADKNSTLAHNKNTCVRLRETCDIEDLMKSYDYGLKGKVDVVGNFRVYNKQTRRFRDEQRAVLEVKTGVSRLCRNHTAQVELYHMLSEGDRANNNSAYLTYLQNEPILHQVNYPNHNIRRDLCMKRNQLNAYLKDYFWGPDTLARPSSCRTCERLTECQLMGKIYDLDEDKFPHIARLERDATGHLDEKFLIFFARQHERLTKLIHGNYHQASNLCPISTRVAADHVQGFPLRLLQLAVGDAPNGAGQDRQVSFVRSKRFIENFLASVEVTRQVHSQPDPKRLKLDDTKPAIRVRPFEFSGNLHLYCRVAIKLDRDANERGSGQIDGQDNYQVVTGTLCELKEDRITVKLSNARSRSLLKPDLIYRLDRLAASQRHKGADLELMRQVLVLLLGRVSRREVRVRKLVTDPDYRPKQSQGLSVSLQMTEYLGLTELRSELEPLVFEAVATNNYYVINERSLAPNKSKLDKLISAMVEVIISLDRRVLIVAQDVDSLVHLMDSLKLICKFLLVSDPNNHQAPSSSRAQTQFASNIVRVSRQQQDSCSGEPDSVVGKYNAFIRAHELAPVIVTTFHASRSNLLFAKQTFDYCIAYDCDKTELLICLAPMFCCDRHIIIDIDDGQCGGDGSSLNCDNLAASLGEHLRNLRPELYGVRGDGGCVGGNI